jgi:hypothetical protein
VTRPFSSEQLHVQHVPPPGGGDPAYAGVETLAMTGVTQAMAPAAPIRLRAVLLDTRLSDSSGLLMTPPDIAQAP